MAKPTYRNCREYLTTAIEEALCQAGGRLNVSGQGKEEIFRCYRSQDAAPILSDHWLWKYLPMARLELVTLGVVLGNKLSKRGYWEFTAIKFVNGAVVPPARIPVPSYRAIYLVALNLVPPECKLGGTDDMDRRFMSLTSDIKNGKYPKGSVVSRVFVIQSDHKFRDIESRIHDELKAQGRYDETEEYGTECFFGKTATIVEIARAVMDAMGVVYVENCQWSSSKKPEG